MLWLTSGRIQCSVTSMTHRLSSRTCRLYCIPRLSVWSVSRQSEEGEVSIFRSDVREECACGITWHGKPGCSFQCEECGPGSVDEDALEEWEHKRREKLAERNE